jgi:hypothetical protein
MPCRDEGHITLPEAALCAIMKVLVNRDLVGSVIADIDWKKAGITEDQLYRWWIDHKITDQSMPRVW